MNSNPKGIDTADHVLHTPSGERWFVACVIDDKLSWVGYPEGQASVKDCELLEKASEEGRENLLKCLADSRYVEDHRTRYAKKRLNSNQVDLNKG